MSAQNNKINMLIAQCKSCFKEIHSLTYLEGLPVVGQNGFRGLGFLSLNSLAIKMNTGNVFSTRDHFRPPADIHYGNNAANYMATPINTI